MRTHVLSLAVLLLAACSHLHAAAEVVYCTGYAPKLHLDEVKRGKSVLEASGAYEPNGEAVVYVGRGKAGLLVQSNLRWNAHYPGSKHVKFTTHSQASLSKIVEYVVDPAEYEWAGRIRDHRTSVRFLLDENLFDGNRELPIPLDGARELFVVRRGETHPRRLVRIHPTRGPPQWVCEYEDAVPGRTILVRLSTGATKARRILDGLAGQQLREDQVRVLSLFTRTSVEQRLNDSSLGERLDRLPSLSRKNLERESDEPPRSRAIREIENVFSANPGRVFFVLGHVSEGRFRADFATRDGGNRVVLDMPVQEVGDLARRHRCRMIAVGCRTAGEVEVGIGDSFNPIAAIERLEAAVERGNMLASLAEISRPDARMPLVLDPRSFETESGRGEFDVAKLGATRDRPQNLEASREHLRLDRQLDRSPLPTESDSDFYRQVITEEQYREALAALENPRNHVIADTRRSHDVESIGGIWLAVGPIEDSTAVPADDSDSGPVEASDGDRILLTVTALLGGLVILSLGARGIRHRN